MLSKHRKTRPFLDRLYFIDLQLSSNHKWYHSWIALFQMHYLHRNFVFWWQCIVCVHRFIAKRNHNDKFDLWLQTEFSLFIMRNNALDLKKKTNLFWKKNLFEKNGNHHCSRRSNEQMCLQLNSLCKPQRFLILIINVQITLFRKS